MLVKLLTEHGQKPTIVVWDAGHSGRKEVSAEYKATRQSRPDLLKEQWPHLAPLVEAFGYRTSQVDGYEADDVIASIAEKARDAGRPGRRSSPATATSSSSSTRTRRSGSWRPAAGSPTPSCMTTRRSSTATASRPSRSPTSTASRATRRTTSPASRASATRPPPQLLQTGSATWRPSWRRVDEISGAKRKENLDQPRRRRADLQAAGDDHARHPGRRRPGGRGRARARPLQAARGLPRVRAARAAARAWRRRWPPTTRPASRAAMPAEPENVRVRAREGGVAEVRALGQRSDDAEVALALDRARGPRGPAAGRGARLALRRLRGGGGARRHARRPGRARRRARRPPGRSPTTPRRWASSRPTSRTTRCWPPTCWSPRAAASRSPRSARSAASRSTSDRAAGRRGRAAAGADAAGSASSSTTAA